MNNEQPPDRYSESETHTGSDPEVKKAEINAETAKIAWRELQRFFAQGKVIAVSPSLDLVEVAYEVSCDNHARVEEWMAVAKVGKVTDAQALEWLEANALVWSVVVRPWVLVQPVLRNPEQ